MRVLAKCIMLMLVISTSACTSFTASRSFDPEKKGSKNLVVVSFDQPFPVVKWMYHKTDKHKGIRGFDERFISTAKITRPIMDGGVFIFPLLLEEGEYEFFRWTTPEFGLYYYSINDFSLKFTVVDGKVNYIGNVKLGIEGEDDFYLEVVDREGRDIDKVLSSYSKISRSNIVSSLMSNSIVQ